MTNERYMTVERSASLPLTTDEVSEGWHFCLDWDGMLVGPGMVAFESCLCHSMRI